MSLLAESTRFELDGAFRRILRDVGVKGVLAGHVADLINAVERSITHSPLSAEEVAAAIVRDGGFIRFGEASSMIDGHYVSPGKLVDALVHLHRAGDGSPESTEPQ